MFKNNEGTYPAVGQFLLGIAPGSFSPQAPGQFGARVERMLEELAAQPGVRLPGDRRHGFRHSAESTGVSVPESLYSQLLALAE